MTTSLTSQIPDSKILLYQTEDGHTRIEVQFKGDTVWLTQEQMAELFGKGRSTVTEHISNVYEESELKQSSTCRKFRQVRQEGSREVEREIDYYNLDVVISVGYRVKPHFLKLSERQILKGKPERKHLQRLMVKPKTIKLEVLNYSNLQNETIVSI